MGAPHHALEEAFSTHGDPYLTFGAAPRTHGCPSSNLGAAHLIPFPPHGIYLLYLYLFCGYLIESYLTLFNWGLLNVIWGYLITDVI